MIVFFRCRRCWNCRRGQQRQRRQQWRFLELRCDFNKDIQIPNFRSDTNIQYNESEIKIPFDLVLQSTNSKMLSARKIYIFGWPLNSKCVCR